MSRNDQVRRSSRRVRPAADRFHMESAVRSSKKPRGESMASNEIISPAPPPPTMVDVPREVWESIDSIEEAPIVSSAISFSTSADSGIDLQQWNATRGSAALASRGELDVGRLMGYLRFNVTCKSRGPDVLKELTRVHCNEVRFRRAGKTRELVPWDCDGELSTALGSHLEGHVLISRLHVLVSTNSCAHADVVSSLKELCSETSSPWQRPLVRLRTIRPCLVASEHLIHVAYAVYGGRLLFEMVSDPDIQNVINALIPVVPCIPLRQLATNPVMFTKSSRSIDENRFTLTYLMHAAENTGYPTLNRAPPSLTTSLFEYQSSTVRWMIDHEQDSQGLNSYFWQRRNFFEDDSMFYFPLGGELRLQEPPLATGGILAEELGLGKTIECIATIVGNFRPFIQYAPSFQYKDVGIDMMTATYKIGEDRCIESGATLIIAPPVLLGQWADEFSTHISKDVHLRIVSFPHHNSNLRHIRLGDMMLPDGSQRLCDYILNQLSNTSEHRHCLLPRRIDVLVPCSNSREDDSVLYSASLILPDMAHRLIETFISDIDRLYECQLHLHCADVVLTTYNVFQKNHLLFHRIHWHRIILDESQMVRVTSSSISKLCASLQSTHRWIVTGTPFHSSIDDLHGQLQFIRVWPFSLANDGFWERCIHEQWLNHDERVHNLLYNLLSVTSMRHTKAQTYVTNGLPLIGSLAPRIVEWYPIELYPESDECDRHESYVTTYLQAIAARTNTRATIGGHDAIVRAVQSIIPLLLQSCTMSAIINRESLDYAVRCSITGASTPRQSLGKQTSDGDDDDNRIGISCMPASQLFRLLLELGTSRLNGLNRDIVGRHRAVIGDDIMKRRETLSKLSLDDIKLIMKEKGVSPPTVWHRASRIRVQALHNDGRAAVCQSIEQDEDDVIQYLETLQRGCKIRIGNISSRDRPCDCVFKVEYVDLDRKAIVVDRDIDWTLICGASLLNATIFTQTPPSNKIAWIDAILTAEQVHEDVHEAGFNALNKAMKKQYVSCCCVKYITSMKNVQQEQHPSQSSIDAHIQVKCPICRRPVRIGEITEMILDIDDADEELTMDMDHVVHSEDDMSRRVAYARRVTSITPKSGNTYRIPDVTWRHVELTDLDETLNRYDEKDANAIRTTLLDATCPGLGREILYRLNRLEELNSFVKVRTMIEDMITTLRVDSTAKFVVFSHFVRVFERLIPLLRRHGIVCASLTSSSPIQRRLELQRFRSESSVKVLLLLTGSSTSGLSLPQAHVVYMLEPSVHAKDEAQALGRCHRVGQSKVVRCIVFFRCQSIEEWVLAWRSERSGGNFSEYLDSTSSLAIDGTDGDALHQDQASDAKGFRMRVIRHLLNNDV